MQYELFYLVGERQEAKLDTIKAEVNAILVSGKASLLEPELSEKRKLAYAIKHQNKGTYITRRFELPEIDEKVELKNQKEFGIEAITKKLNLFSDVLRFLIVRTEDLPDLGAKARRKAQELSTQKQVPLRPPQRLEQASFQVKPPVRKPPQPKPPKPPTKEEAKDIDEQLDKLLNI